jgi:hydrogenase maturation protease
VSARVLVAGIGNVFLGDDGFGVEVARRLAAEPLPDGVEVADVGIRALHLAFALLDGPELLLVVDAVSRGDPPGTLTLVEPRLDGAAAGGGDGAGPDAVPDAHGMSLATVAAAVRALGGELPRTLLVGCEPAFVGERMGLGPEVEGALPGAVAMVKRAIAGEVRDDERSPPTSQA